ncbi:MAG: ribose 5-phosphate isomerase B [Eubacteriales bacterium]|nr:ribose 5-phosphate isomerase B [Eubacteriales bacterium]
MENKKKIYAGCDHGGFELKNLLIAHLEELGYEVEDEGCFSEESCNYPDYASAVCRAVRADAGSLGLLVCGTGIGMSISANKYRGIRAALCGDVFSAKMTRRHNNANVLCLGARVVGPGLATEIADAFFSSAFEGGRHEKRIAMIGEIENSEYSGNAKI